MAKSKIHAKVTTGGASALALAAKPGITWLMLENDSDVIGQNIYVNIAGAAAVVGQGMMIPPDGYIEFNGSDACPSQAIYAIAEAGAPNLLITYA